MCISFTWRGKDTPIIVDTDSVQLALPNHRVFTSVEISFGSKLRKIVKLWQQMMLKWQKQSLERINMI